MIQLKSNPRGTAPGLAGGGSGGWGPPLPVPRGRGREAKPPLLALPPPQPSQTDLEEINRELGLGAGIGWMKSDPAVAADTTEPKKRTTTRVFEQAASDALGGIDGEQEEEARF